MANPAWFNAAHYADQKVIQMNASQYLGQSDWDVSRYEQQLNTFRDINNRPIPGATTEDKAYQNFLACNGSGYDTAVVTRADINVSPNEYFDVGVYVTNLAEYMNRTEAAAAPEGGWTGENVLLHLYNDLHMSAWDHYTNVGMFANINPSNDFDTLAYMQQRREAMNTYENSDGSVGWHGSSTWTLIQVQQYLQSIGVNPIMDAYDAGKLVFDLTPPKVSQDDVVTVVEDWTPWTVPAPFNPYEHDVTVVDMTTADSSYQGETGVNTRFEAYWNGQADSTIAPADIINGGVGARNTLAVELNAPWPGFQNPGSVNVQNVGRVELNHGAVNPGTPYTFDARNIQDLERVDIHAADGESGTGPISLKNLGASVRQVNIYDLKPTTPTQTQITGIEFAPGVHSGSNDSLTIGLTNVGADTADGYPAGTGAPAPIALTGVETITLNAMQGQNFVNLQSVSGAKTLNVTGGGDIKVVSVPNGIGAYDLSGASGRTNVLASDLKASTVVKGGLGVDSLGLTQDLKGTPVSWTGVESLFVSPGVSVDMSAVNIQGLRDLWVDSGKDVIINNLPTTENFAVYETYKGSKGKVTVNGDIHNLTFSNANYSADEGSSTSPIVTSNVTNDVSLYAVGKGTVGGEYSFTNAKGTLAVVVNEEATLGAANITAQGTNSLNIQASGAITNGVSIQAVDNSYGEGSIVINAAQGISPQSAQRLGQIVLNADGAGKMEVTTGGDFTLGGSSSLTNLADLTLNVDGANSSFNALSLKDLPKINQVTISGEGNVALTTLGSTSQTHSLEITVDSVSDLAIKGIQTGGNANITANINATGTVALGAVSTAIGNTAASATGDVHLNLTGTQAQTFNQNGTVITGADIFMDLGDIAGDAFTRGGLNLAAGESINYTGASGTDLVTVTSVGAAVPSSIDLGAGSDSLTISNRAVSQGQRVTLSVDLGADNIGDSLYINSQRQGRLGVYVDNFHEGEDGLMGFHASSITRSQGQALLSSFGVANTSEGSLTLLGFGSGKGVLYDGDLYAFNSSSATNATTMVVLTGINDNVTNLVPIVIPEPEPDEATVLLA